MKFTKIYELPNIEYSLGWLGGLYYLKVEHYENIATYKKRWFKLREVNKRVKSFEYLMPLSAAVHVAMLRTLTLNKVYEEEMMGEMVDVYQRIDPEDHNIIMEDFRAIIKLADDGHRYKTPNNPKNKVARGFKNEGYHYLGEEELNKINKVHTLYKVSPIEGYLTVVLVNEMGKPNDMSTTDVAITQLTRDLIYNIFDYMNLLEGEE